MFRGRVSLHPGWQNYLINYQVNYLGLLFASLHTYSPPLPALFYTPEADLFGKHHLGSSQLTYIWLWTMKASTGERRQEEREIGYILSILSLF